MVTQVAVHGGPEQVPGLAELSDQLDALSRTTSEIRVDTRDRILAAAVRLFAIHGFEACTVKQIAAEVGIKPPGLYAHFPSKEAVLSAAMSRELRKFLAFVLEPDDGPDSYARLEGLIRRHVLYQIQNQRSTMSNDLLLNNEATQNALGSKENALFRKTQRIYLDHLQAVIVRAEAVAAQRNARVATLAVLSLCDRVNSWYRPGGALSETEVADEYWLLAKGMLGLPELG